MQPFTRNKSNIQTTPRERLNSIEQTKTRMKLKFFSEQTSYDYKHIINVSEFIMQRINSEKLNKTDRNLTRFIFSFCSSHELVLNFYRQ